MIFNEEVRKSWPPTKTDYKIFDRVKVIDMRDLKDKGSFMRSFLGHVGTIKWIDTEVHGRGEPLLIIHFEKAGQTCCAFWCDEVRPALPDELPTPLDKDVDVDKMPFGWKAILVGTMRPAQR